MIRARLLHHSSYLVPVSLCMYMCHFSCYLTFCLIIDLYMKYMIRNSMLGLTRFQCFAIIPRWCISVNYYNNIVVFVAYEWNMFQYTCSCKFIYCKISRAILGGELAQW